MSNWNAFYSVTPRPGPEPRLWPAFGLLGAALICLAAGVAVLVLFPLREHRDLLGVVAVLLTAAITLPVGALVAWGIYHKRHTWKWGEAELVMAVWSIPDDVSSVGLSMVFMPLSVMLHGLDFLIGHLFMNRMFVACQRPIGNRIDQVKVPIRFAPEGGRTVGYTWICRSTARPRRWYALGDIMPGGTFQQVIPDESVAELSQELARIRSLDGGKPLPQKPLPRKDLRLPQRNSRT